MRFVRIALFTTLFVCALTRGAEIENGPIEAPTTIPEPLYPVAEAVNTFGAELLTSYRASVDSKNVIFSPLSLCSAFFFLYLGAEGKTKQEIGNLFGFKNGEVATAVSTKHRELRLGSALLASRLYVDSSITIKSAYAEEIGKRKITAVDFAKDTEAARESINNWVSEKTNDFIPELIAKGILTPATLFVLVNALHFQGTWQRKFSKSETKRDVFHSVKGDQMVPFMKLTDVTLAYKEIPELNGKMIVLPYQGNEYSMYIFLPNKKNGWRKAEKNYADYAGSIFDTGYLRQQFSLFSMPKWEMDTELEDLKKMLIELGLPITFSNAADFTRITKDGPLRVSDVIHKAKIIVDEEGTEAAAATAIISVRSAVIFPAIEVVIDRPFLYFIVSDADRTVLFQGTQTSI